MKKIYLTLAIGLITIGALHAQSNIVTFNYSMGFGTGDVKDFISKPSFRGFGFDFRKLVTPNVGVGGSIGWNVFYEELAKDAYTVGNSTLSGKQFRYSNHIPMLANATYYLKPGEQFNPFVGLGIGVTYTRRNTDMNLYTLEQEAWNFTLQPEFGFLYNMSDEAAFSVSGKFNQGFKAGSELKEAQSFFSLNLGFAFTK
jgi:opacity protein-like surface antigen